MDKKPEGTTKLRHGDYSGSDSGSGNDNKDTGGCVHASKQRAFIWLIKHIT